ncbi:deoxyguanosinetriphosphate triphosphohydrolase family protein [Kosmotoga pacifica]|uniref:HD domain-containing protein n=1 Tax=Kosmotoga pacifica TaxID=1330330 RepID=A0A0G2Z508_9BACT|nr:HD domain-containing protein [Kosmotoga pacifica]AKI96637.1 hypothetical protein IX53_01035 [Kosmotoga pacifica]
MSEGLNNPIADSILKKRKKERPFDIRGAYFRDQTAIIHSMGFRRLKNKTQVFYSPQNDHICTRIEHVLHVSTIASSICKGLHLNIELAQAIALGHDIGHAPFGHAGEAKLDELMIQHNAGHFYHEVNSLRVLDYLDNYGKGLNLTYAVRDGIISHCGENFEQYVEICSEKKKLGQIENRNTNPVTYEGAVVRLADKIAYLGRDIEDAIVAGLIKDSDVPKKVRTLLGKKNGEIIDTLVKDVIEHSRVKGKIGLSSEKYELMVKLKDFNYKCIYKHPRTIKMNQEAQNIIEELFNGLLEKIKLYGLQTDCYDKDKNLAVKTFGRFILKRINLYREELKKLQLSVPSESFMVRVLTDYISGMTDSYVIKQLRLLKPELKADIAPIF